MKKSKNNNIILVFSFMNLVSVDAKERSFKVYSRNSINFCNYRVLFINRFYAMFGASPETIYKDHVVKVRCPWVFCHRNLNTSQRDSLQT